MLQPLNIQGLIITAYALHTQVETAKFIVKKGADYVFTVKDNQSKLNDDIITLDLESFPFAAQTTEKGHGRIEIRTIWTSAKINNYVNFPIEVVSGITSLTKKQANAANILDYNRNHWGIEDRLHYIRDHTCDEDKSQIRKKNGP